MLPSMHILARRRVVLTQCLKRWIHAQPTPWHDKGEPTTTSKPALGGDSHTGLAIPRSL